MEQMYVKGHMVGNGKMPNVEKALINYILYLYIVFN